MIKYILIPEYRPLYAMRHCFGPTHGPLTKPCPTPVDVIGQLLQQTGKEAVSIYEVKYDTVKQTTTGDPIRLTLENYKMPYDQIVNAKSVEPESRSVTMVSEVKTVKPTVVLPKEATTISNVIETTEEFVVTMEEEKVDTTSIVAEAEVSVKAEPVNDSYGDSEEEVIEPVENNEEVPASVVLEEKVLPNLEGTVTDESLSVSVQKEEAPRLTKSQRKELRRQALKEQRREMQERRNALSEKKESEETTPEV